MSASTPTGSSSAAAAPEPASAATPASVTASGPLTAFHCFSELPMELQMRMWEIANPRGTNALTFTVEFLDTLRGYYVRGNSLLESFFRTGNSQFWRDRMGLWNVCCLARQVGIEAWRREVIRVVIPDESAGSTFERFRWQQRIEFKEAVIQEFDRLIMMGVRARQGEGA